LKFRIASSIDPACISRMLTPAMAIIEHTPSPGTRAIHTCGDTVTFRLVLDHAQAGGAWLRTNVGHAHERRLEIINHVEHQQPILSRDWHDIPMQAAEGETAFHLEVPLAEIGRFEAKAFFLPQGEHDPVWPEGDNIVLKVEPTHGICGNMLYTAFVRQFGPHMAKREVQPQQQKTIKQLDDAGYTVIPKSGTFRKLIGGLDHIIGTMGFRIIQLLPIHPVPTTYARMGRFGSPFASIDFFDVDPALAEFDRKTTPLDQFGELVDGIHARAARVFLDLPINHTGWASHLQMHHPDWFARNHDASFMSPGAWGVTWEDLSELDYDHRELWQYMADVFLFWCRRGVDGFRCDAGYMVPLPVWEYIVAKVREEYPETLFLLEGLGGKIRVTEALLDRANLNWAYSEIFQVYDRRQMEHYLPQSQAISRSHGTLIQFAETHDNSRLAAESQPYAQMRTALAALFSDAGAFGITNGVEWFATTKVDVHGAPPMNWGSPDNQVAFLARLNAILEQHPAFRCGVPQRLIQTGGGNAIALLRSPDDGGALLVAVNLDCESAQTVTWAQSDFDLPEGQYHELLTDEDRKLWADSGHWVCQLAPAEVVCLAPREANQERWTSNVAGPSVQPVAVIAQRRRATALSLYCHWTESSVLEGMDAASLAEQLIANPVEFCEAITRAPLAQSVTTWRWPEDQHRTVMLPCHHALRLVSPKPFHAELLHESTRMSVVDSLEDETGNHFAFLFATPSNSETRRLTLRIATPRETSCEHSRATLLQLPATNIASVATRFGRGALRGTRRYALLTNNHGAMSQVRLEWGEIESQYDCLLGANLNEEVPVDRQIAFTRCRAWLVHRGYSQPITADCIQDVTIDPNRSTTWQFCIPSGLGSSVTLELSLTLAPNTNRIHLDIHRTVNTGSKRDLAATESVTLILRPDIEDRNFHETTKAYTGAENHWPNSIAARKDGFSFTPHPHRVLNMQVERGDFVHEAEWTYGVPHPFEADRGLAGDGDLFSPGYFKVELTGDASTQLTASMGSPSERHGAKETALDAPRTTEDGRCSLLDAMHIGMQAFIVKREDTRTVIAGYPWFLDWGRDTLICLRGIIAAGLLEASRDILVQFARFEKHGTLPNMIRGNDDSNRDTSDAPLWFFTACSDLIEAEGDDAFLTVDCRGRPVKEVLISIAEHYIAGTPNGILMDPDTALVFSPSHYTWMDTNHPAGTPRVGYPVEIQALWYAALAFLARIDEDPRWPTLAAQVRESLQTLYRLPDRNYLADCLLATPGTKARDATPDNALRPNQLFAITLGAIEDRELARGILSASERLLIPGAIRSLADQPVSPPLAIHRDGELLNDPERPFWGHYSGDEDTRRKPAYHNGTAWTWPFPSYCEALYQVEGAALRETAVALLGSSSILADEGCIGHIPEILDANTPHRQRGCGAQAWGETELYRVLALLQRG
jgi:starch synthase (maltosyl-transferring)